MSEMGSSWTPGSRLSCTSPQRNENGRDDGGGHSSLRTMVQGMPMFALGVAVTLASSYVRQALSNPTSTANSKPVDMLAFALLGLFSSSLASITFHAKLPFIASCFEDITVFFIASTFASLIYLWEGKHSREIGGESQKPVMDREEGDGGDWSLPVQSSGMEAGRGPVRSAAFQVESSSAISPYGIGVGSGGHAGVGLGESMKRKRGGLGSIDHGPRGGNWVGSDQKWIGSI
ncbi:hypothetical protein COCNU_11G001070 [Cocos nucifera]|uniref:Uncharacterized protein n=1 Tax=Cocos nucifera TaxID=13894 RepID=A0A8K0ING2_COCNU|nr:hypothetical protein COCNU_11G001070 [Cocos nucifera]